MCLCTRCTLRWDKLLSGTLRGRSGLLLTWLREGKACVWKGVWCTWCCWRCRRSTPVTSTEGVAHFGRPSLDPPSMLALPLWLAGPLLVASVPDSCIMIWEPGQRRRRRVSGAGDSGSQLLKHTAVRLHFNCGPNYKHLSCPSHTIPLLLQVSL